MELERSLQLFGSHTGNTVCTEETCSFPLCGLSPVPRCECTVHAWEEGSLPARWLCSSRAAALSVRGSGHSTMDIVAGSRVCGRRCGRPCDGSHRLCGFQGSRYLDSLVLLASLEKEEKKESEAIQAHPCQA